MRSLQAIILALLALCFAALTRAANQAPPPSADQQSPQQINDLKSSFDQKINDFKSFLGQRIEDTKGGLEKRIDDTNTKMKELKESNLVAQLAWPLAVSGLVLVTWFTGLRRLLPRLTAIKVYKDGPEILIRDLETSLDQEIKKTVEVLARIFPPGKADKYLPSPQPDLDYYVHVVEFLDTIKVPLTNPAVVWNAVGAYYFDRDREKSRKAFERAITHDPNDPSPYTTLGMWHLRINQDNHVAHAQFTESVRLAKKKGISSPWAHVGLAAVARNIGNERRKNTEIQLAQEEFHKALAVDASDYWSLHGLGWCLLHDKARFSDAQPHIEKVIKLMPKFDAAHYNLACLHAMQNNPDAAVAALKRLVEEAKIKLERLGVNTEKDFQPIQNNPAFRQFFATFDLMYNP
jgi:tetratricopeptide (TPR) repeat protein